MSEDILEDAKEVNEETKKDIEEGLAAVRAGKIISLKAIKKKYHSSST